MPIEITSPDDERVADYFRLTDVALRKKLETERGLYIAESEKVIRRALSRGDVPRSFLMGERWLTDLADVVADAEAQGVPVYVGEADVIESMTGFHLHRGALASMNRPALADPAELLRGARRVVVLEDIVDHTNVGCSNLRDSSTGNREGQKRRSRIAVLDGLVDHTKVGALIRNAAARLASKSSS